MPIRLETSPRRGAQEPPALRVVLSEAGPHARGVSLSGAMDHGNADTISAALKAAFEAAPSSAWTFDARGLDFVDTSFVTLLVDLHQRLDAPGSLLVIPTPRLARLLDVLGFADLVSS